tara:strand:- start:8788 stop:9669 length:882 start_codon:yes stop_codon:yes gene_type:complete
MIKSFIISIIVFSYLLSYNDIYSIISNPRNISIGGIHASTDDISSTFDSPLFLNNKNNNIFLSINQYDDLYNIYRMSYCIYASEKSNLLLGLVRREINNNFNTDLAWEDNGSPPILGDINYEAIYLFQDKETGFLIAYNRLIASNFVMGINFKPVFHSIDNINAIGFSFDIRYALKFSNYRFSFGANNILAIKKWDTGLLEKFDLNGYLCTSVNLSDKTILFYEYDLINHSKLGFEMKMISDLFLRLGINNDYYSFGFGLKLNNINFDYSYTENHSIFFGNNHSIGFNINMDN